MLRPLAMLRAHGEQCSAVQYSASSCARLACALRLRSRTARHVQNGSTAGSNAALKPEATAAVDVHGAVSSGGAKVHLPALASSRCSSTGQSMHTLPALAPPAAANDPFAPLPLPKPPRPPVLSSRSSTEGSAKRLVPLGSTMPPQRQLERPDRHLSPLHDIQPESSLSKAPMAPIRPAQQPEPRDMTVGQAETVLKDASKGVRRPERATGSQTSQDLRSKASLSNESSSWEA
eukprot:4948847-Pleurochrysis_carterae.AAC.1